MKTTSLSGRQLRRHIQLLLGAPDISRCREVLLAMPGRRAVNPLFACLYDSTPRIRWRAVQMMGVVVAELAESDVESARIILRRLMWNLNDESGGIGWGSPEAMGEILAHSDRLAGEFGNILKSYIREDGNYLEHEALQQGALWGVGRFAHARPRLTRDIASALKPFLLQENLQLMGLALWAAAANRDPSIQAVSADFLQDPRTVEIYIEDDFVKTRIRDLAARVLAESPS